MRAYGTKNGQNPLEIKAGKKMLKQAGEAIASEVLKQAIKNGGRIVDLGGNLNTGSLSFHVHIICVYKFVHNGDQSANWQILQKKKILSNQGVDYFVKMADAEPRIRQEMQKIRKDLDDKLIQQCQEHENE